jgi:hypothetical protein
MLEILFPYNLMGKGYLQGLDSRFFQNSLKAEKWSVERH